MKTSQLLLVVTCLTFALPAFSQKNALHFDGAESHVLLPTAPELETEFTFEFRFKQDGPSTNYRTLLDHSDPENGTCRLRVQVLDGEQLTCFMDNGLASAFLFNDALVAGWNVASVSWDGNELKTFLNGASTAITPSGNPLPNMEMPIYLGQDATGGNHFAGAIDELRMWDHARCINLVEAYDGVEMTDSPQGLTNHYTFNHGWAGANNSSHTQLIDREGGLDGVLLGFELIGSTSNWIDGAQGLDPQPDLNCSDNMPETTQDLLLDDCNCIGKLMGCMHVAACNYDPTAEYDNGNCKYPTCNDDDALNFVADGYCPDNARCVYTGNFPTNDTPNNAQSLPLNTEDCTSVLGTLDAAFVDGAGGSSEVWYTLIPPSAAMTLELSSSEVAGFMEVYDDKWNYVGGGNQLNGFGTEYLHLGNLTPGAHYHLAVCKQGTTTSGSFSICASSLKGTTCDYGYGPYHLNQSFKADYVAADRYNFHFSSEATGKTYSSGEIPTTYLRLMDIPSLQPGDVYDVVIDCFYDLVDGAGNDVVVHVPGVQSCQVGVQEPSLSTLNALENCDNHGPHWSGDWVRTNAFRPMVIDWEWRFVRTDYPADPVVVFKGGTDRKLHLASVPGVEEGAVYQVQVRPVYEVFSTQYGEPHCLEIHEPVAGLAAGGPAELDATDFVDRSEVVTKASFGCYPNPNAGDWVQLTWEGRPEGRMVIELLTLGGALLSAHHFDPNQVVVEFGLGDLSPGVYLIKATTASGSEVTRLVVE